MKKEVNRNRKGQITLFIIIAILVVIVLLVIFYPKIKTFVSQEPQTYMKDCAEQAVNEILEKIMLQGGTLNPEHYYSYQDNKIEYICYTNKYYSNCVMQKPFLYKDIEEEITNYVTPKIEQCLRNLKEQLEDKGESVSTGSVSVNTDLTKNFIVLNLETPFTISGDSESSFKNFRVDIRSNLYELVIISSSIANWEAHYGDSDTMSYMFYYPNIKAEKLKQSDGTTLYILTDRETQEVFQFASRSIAWPPGYLGI